jgi:hypothetical protein
MNNRLKWRLCIFLQYIQEEIVAIIDEVESVL